MLEPTVTSVHKAAASPTITAHIPQPTGISGSNVPDRKLLWRPIFINDDYDETVDKLWDVWYKEGVDLIVQDRKVYEKWRTEWSVKDNKKFSGLKFIVEYIQARSEDKPVGLVIAEVKKLQGRKKLSTLEHRLKDQIKLEGGGGVDSRMDHSKKDESGLFDKICKWIVPQNKTMDHSTKQIKKDHSKETEMKRFVDE
jgi:hypothetical protein